MQALPGEATVFLILFARIGAVLMLLPVFSEEAVPGRIRLLMSLGLAAGLWGLLQGKVPAAVTAATALPGVLIAELLVGLSIGMIVKLMFYAAAMAGSIISMQVGLSSVLVYDASQGSQAPLLGKLVMVAATVVCMGFGVHHLWITSLVQSYSLFPVGALPPGEDFARLAVSVTSDATRLAVSLAAPLIVYGIVFNAALGLSARMAPAIQVFFIAQPLNLLIGLSLFAMTIGAVLTTFAQSMAAWMQATWI
jgi:flagellar biosynthetic protein FliR